MKKVGEQMNRERIKEIVYGRPNRELMRRIKTAFKPHGILNSGKVL